MPLREVPNEVTDYDVSKKEILTQITRFDARNNCQNIDNSILNLYNGSSAERRGEAV